MWGAGGKVKGQGRIIRCKQRLTACRDVATLEASYWIHTKTPDCGEGPNTMAGNRSLVLMQR